MSNSCVGLRSLEKLGQDPDFYRGGVHLVQIQPLKSKPAVSPPIPEVCQPAPVVPSRVPPVALQDNAWRQNQDEQATAPPKPVTEPAPIVSAVTVPQHRPSAIWDIKRTLTRELDRLGVASVVIGRNHAATARLSDQLPLQDLARAAQAFVDSYDPKQDVLPTSVQTLQHALTELAELTELAKQPSPTTSS